MTTFCSTSAVARRQTRLGPARPAPLHLFREARTYVGYQASTVSSYEFGHVPR